MKIISLINLANYFLLDCDFESLSDDLESDFFESDFLSSALEDEWAPEDLVSLEF